MFCLSGLVNQLPSIYAQILMGNPLFTLKMLSTQWANQSWESRQGKQAGRAGRESRDGGQGGRADKEGEQGGQTGKEDREGEQGGQTGRVSMEGRQGGRVERVGREGGRAERVGREGGQAGPSNLPLSCSAASLSSGSLNPTRFWFLIMICSFGEKRKKHNSDDATRLDTFLCPQWLCTHSALYGLPRTVTRVGELA